MIHIRDFYDTDNEEKYLYEERHSLIEVNRCKHCGCPLIKMNECGEAWGSDYIEELWICPVCD